jgi:uncharacterized protein
MEAVRLDDASAFLAAADPLLLADEARHNLILGVAGNVRDGVYDDFRLWLVRDGAGVAAAAVQTPPYNLILARPRSPQALGALSRALAGVQLPGLVGAEPEAVEFAQLWSRQTGARPRTNMRQGIYALERVEPLPTVPGSVRVATQDDRQLAERWCIAFGHEVLHAGGPDSVAAMVNHRLSSPTAGLVLWENDGEPVSLAGWGGPTPNGIRVGPVYTPPALRGLGYATALTAELSRRLLDGRLFAGGRRSCFLYTDLANATSNAIYERIGYRRVAESAEIVFG